MVAAARMRLHRVGKSLPGPERRRDLEAAISILVEVIKGSCSVATELAPPVLYTMGLGAGLGWLAQVFEQRYGLRVEVGADPDADPQTEDLRVVLFQVARELLYNIVKHAGVTTVRLTLRRDRRLRRSAAPARRRGFDIAKAAVASVRGGSFGLFSSRERLHLVVGTLRLESYPGRGPL